MSKKIDKQKMGKLGSKLIREVLLEMMIRDLSCRNIMLDFGGHLG